MAEKLIFIGESSIPHVKYIFRTPRFHETVFHMWKRSNFICEMRISYLKMCQFHMFFTSKMTRNFCKGTHKNRLRQNVTVAFIKLKPYLLVTFLLTCIIKKSRPLYVWIGLNILLYFTQDDFTRHGKTSAQERLETGRLWMRNTSP